LSATRDSRGPYPLPGVPGGGAKDLKVRLPLSDERLDEPAIRLPATGFPLQEGAHACIAGQRGCFGTGSFLVLQSNEPDAS
jgi:hypothetical protein